MKTMPALPPYATPKILVVDDQEIIRYSMDSVFTNQGYRVFLASSVAEATEQLASQRPDLVLLDLSMPGADGLVLLRQMRASLAFKKTPVIILTAYSDRNFVLEALQLGSRDYIVKAGLSIDDIVARVRLRLEEAGKNVPRSAVAGSGSMPTEAIAGPALDLAKFLELVQGKNCGRVFPAVIEQARGLSRSSVTSVTEIAEVIGKDPVLSLHILRSACAAAAARILDLEESVRVLGMDNLQILLDSCAVFSTGMDPGHQEDVARLWSHSNFCSKLLAQLAPEIELAGLVGLLHDLPVNLLVSTLSPKDWALIRTRMDSSDKLLQDVIAELFGIPYGEFCNAVMTSAGLPDYLLPAMEEYANVFIEATPISATRTAWVLETIRQWSGVLLLPAISSINLRIPSKEEAALVPNLPEKAALCELADQVWQDISHLGMDFMPQPSLRWPNQNPNRVVRFALRREGWAGGNCALQQLFSAYGDVVGPEMITAGEWDVFVYLGNHPARLWPVGFPFKKPLLVVHRLSEDKCDFPGGKGTLSLRAPCSIARILKEFSRFKS